MVDVGRVVDPFVVDVVFFFVVANHDQVFAGLLSELVDDRKAADITIAGPSQGIAAMEANFGSDVEDKKNHDSAGQCNAIRLAHGAQVAHGLHDQKINGAGEGRGVVRVGPDDRKNSEGAEGQGDPGQAHLAIAQGEGHARQD